MSSPLPSYGASDKINRTYGPSSLGMLLTQRLEILTLLSLKRTQEIETHSSVFDRPLFQRKNRPNDLQGERTESHPVPEPLGVEHSLLLRQQSRRVRAEQGTSDSLPACRCPGDRFQESILSPWGSCEDPDIPILGLFFLTSLSPTKE